VLPARGSRIKATRAAREQAREICSPSNRLTAPHFSERWEGYAMAHREQHGNRESKKPKKDKGRTKTLPSQWAVSEVVEAQAGSKH
jgi:hypothetical protein